MKNLKSCLALGTFATILAVAAAPAAFAQSEREQSNFTITEPLDVGTFTLQPGTYNIQVVQIDANRNMIRVMDTDQKKLYTTVLTRPYPILMSDVIPESRYVVWATPPGQPSVLRTWFPRDRSIGHEIVFSETRAKELAALANDRVIAVPDKVAETEYRTAPLYVVTPDRQVKPYEPKLAAVEPKPAPLQVAETRPARELPGTASRVPLFAALGLLSLGAALGLGALANRGA